MFLPLSLQANKRKKNVSFLNGAISLVCVAILSTLSTAPPHLLCDLQLFLSFLSLFFLFCFGLFARLLLGLMMGGQVTLDERELIALERGTEMFKQCALNAEEALEEAKTLFATYNKLVDRLIGQLLDKMCQCTRAEDATRAAVNLIKTSGTQETKTALAAQLRSLPAAAEYRVTAQREWGQQGTIDTLKSRTTDAINKWNTMISPDVVAADGLVTVLRSLEQRVQNHKSVNPARPVSPRMPRAVTPPPVAQSPPIVVDATDEEGVSHVEEFFQSPTPQQPRRSAVSGSSGSSTTLPQAVEPKKDPAATAKSEGDSSPSAFSGMRPLQTKKGPVTPADANSNVDSGLATLAEKSPRSRPQSPAGASTSSNAVVGASTPIPSGATSPGRSDPNSSGGSGGTPGRNKKKFATLTKKTFLSLFAQAKEEAELEISGPMDVQHAGHLGVNSSPDPDAVKKMTDELLQKQKIEVEARAKAAREEEEEREREAERKRKEEADLANNNNMSNSGTIKSPGRKNSEGTGSPKRIGSATWRLTLKRKPKEGGTAAEDAEPELQIGTPEEVAHEGHVSPNEAKPEAVADVIDSVVNKQKAVNVDEVLAQEIPFSQEYDPNA